MKYRFATLVAVMMLAVALLAAPASAKSDRAADGEGRCWGAVVSLARSSGQSAHAAANLGYPGGWRALEAAHDVTPCELLDLLTDN